MSFSTEAVKRCASDQVSLDVEDVVDGGVDGDKTLSGSGRFEALHLALPSSQRLVRVFGPVVGAQTLLGPPRTPDQRQRRAVGSDFVSDNQGRREALPLQQFPEQLHRGGLVAPR